MLKKSMVLAVSLVTASVAYADQVNLIVTGVLDNNVPEYSGKEVAFHINYESDTPQDNPSDEYLGIYRLKGDNIINKIVVDNDIYFSSTPPFVNAEAMVNVHGGPDDSVEDQIKFISQENFRKAGAVEDINDVNILLTLANRGTIALPKSADEFGALLDNRSFAAMSVNGQFLNVKLRGVYEQPIIGCQRQSTYDITAVAPLDNPDPANPGAMQTIKASLTLTPNNFISDSYQTLDFSPSSALVATIGTDTIGTGIYNFNDPNSFPTLRIYADENIVRIESEPANVVVNGQPGGHISMELFGRIHNEPGMPPSKDIPQVLRMIDFQDGILRADNPISGQIHANITDIKLVSGNCSVIPELKESSLNQFIEPVFLSNKVISRAVVPSSGGRFYVSNKFTNNQTTTKKVRQWSEIILPNGQQYPGNSVKTSLVDPSIPLIEQDKSVYILKNMPNGIYTYNLYTLGFDDMIPQKVSVQFRKGDMDNYLP